MGDRFPPFFLANNDSLCFIPAVSAKIRASLVPLVEPVIFVLVFVFYVPIPNWPIRSTLASLFVRRDSITAGWLQVAISLGFELSTFSCTSLLFYR